MENINKVELQCRIGNINIFEVAKTAKFSVGVSEIFQSKNGTIINETTWLNIVAFSSDKVDINLAKGDAVKVVGRLRNIKYVGNDGQERYTTEILASEVRKI